MNNDYRANLSSSLEIEKDSPELEFQLASDDEYFLR